MALSIAHAAAGYLVYEAARPTGSHRSGLLLGAVVLANAADLDFLPGIVAGDPDLFHRGFTHTLGATLLVTVVTALVARLARRRWAAVWRLGAFVGTAYGSHLLVDYVTADAVSPHGAQFLWPFSDAYHLAPVPLLEELIVDRSGRLAFFQSLLSREAIGRWGTEVLLLAGAVGLVHGVRAVWAGVVAAAGPVGEES